LTFRMVVESGAAELLAQSGCRPGQDRDLLLARLDGVNNARPSDYRRLDPLVHLALPELTGSSMLAAACADARMRLNDLLNAIPVLQHNIRHTAQQHSDIVDAILAGDANRARTTVAEHLDGTAALLRGFLANPPAAAPAAKRPAKQASAPATAVPGDSPAPARRRSRGQ